MLHGALLMAAHLVTEVLLSYKGNYTTRT